MKSMSSAFGAYKPKVVEKTEKRGITNPRQSIIKMFLDRLNAARSGGINPKTKKPLEPLTAAFVGKRLQWWKGNQSLREFYGYCAEAKNFSSTWWYKTDPKNYTAEVLDKKAL